MTPKPPPCPACHSPRVVPVVRGLPTEEAELAARDARAVIGGGVVLGDGSEPEWACQRCDRTFGGVSSPRTPAAWDPLIRRMLPAPVKDMEAGIVGGDPREVVVRVTDQGIDVGVFRVEWLNSHTPEVVIKDWKHLPLDSKPAAVSRAIQAARGRRLRTYRWCTLCHEVKPPEWSEGGRCYACMERNGVVF